MRQVLKFRIMAWLASLALAWVAYAQIGGGSIVGLITDQSGAPVANVKVTAKNQRTNESNTVATNERGYYEFPLLPAGVYRLEAEAQGFDKAVGAEFELNAGTRPRIDLQLKVGSITQTVEVNATAPLINATNTELGVVIDQVRVEELPLNGRDFQELLTLQAGVENAPDSSAGGRGGVSFHGSSALSTNMMLDGVDMSFGEVNGSASLRAAGGGSVLINTVSVEAMSEFKATGSAFSAEYGRSGGGVVNITTKSGTNQLRGTLFEYFRNDKLDANDFFSNAMNLPKPPLRWNQFGGNLGGPIKRDRAFFFFNYEGAQVGRLRKITGNTATKELLAAVPPLIRKTLETYLPSDYTPTTNVYVGYHTRNDQQWNKEHTFLTRGDLSLTKHRLAGRHSYNRQDFTSPNFGPKFPTLYPMRFHNVVFQDNWNVTSTSFNELRLGVNRVNLNRDVVNRETIPAWISAPSSVNASLSSYIHFISTTYTIADNFMSVRGAHSMKTGFEIREVRSVRVQGGLPTYSYNTFPNLIADRPLSVSLLFGGGKGLRTRNLGFYFQDEWRLSRNIQVNAGIRYEYTPPFRGGFNIATSDPFGPFIQAQEPMFRADRNNFAPRVGIVFALDDSQRTVVRVGGAVSYTAPQAIFYYDMAFVNPRLPFTASFAIQDAPPEFVPYPRMAEFTDRVIADPSLLPKNFRLSRNVADYNRRDTYVNMWNLALQRAVTRGFAVQAAYVGQRTVKLLSVRPLNQIDPILRDRPVPELGVVNVQENAANISYHALQLSANQRTWKGLRYDTYFTWAKAIGYYNPDETITFTAPSGLQDPLNIAGSKGPVRGLPKFRLNGVISYAIPGGKRVENPFLKGLLRGWTFRSILTARSGMPINVTSGSDIVGTGRSAGQRPDPVYGVDPYIRNRQALTWLTPAAFTTVFTRLEKRYGYLGYNVFTGTPQQNINAALHKTFAFRESQRITFRFELFNVLNRAPLGNPVTSISDPNFGKIQTAGTPRNIQLALKYTF